MRLCWFVFTVIWMERSGNGVKYHLNMIFILKRGLFLLLIIGHLTDERNSSCEGQRKLY